MTWVSCALFWAGNMRLSSSLLVELTFGTRIDKPGAGLDLITSYQLGFN